MADLASNQQSSSAKRPWYSDLSPELGTQHFAGNQEHSYNDTQPKRSRQVSDGGTNLTDCNVVSGIFSGCCKTGTRGSARDGKSTTRTAGLFDSLTQNGGSSSGDSPSNGGRPPDGYEDPSPSHSMDSMSPDGMDNEHCPYISNGHMSSPEENKTSEHNAFSDSAADGGSDNEDDEDDNVSTISELSGISIEGWRPVAGPISWVQRQMEAGVDPRSVLGQIVPHDTVIPADFDDLTLWKIVINLIAEPPKRTKLSHINTLEDVMHLLTTCKKIMVLTGAGVSVSCGIPDFRSRDGIYSRLAVEYPDLPDPQAMFDIVYFRKNPKPFFKFAKEIYPGQFAPSPSHRFIQLLESKDKLLRNYTQNIDTLEQVAGIKKVIQCHGSFATATCMACKYKTDADAVKEDVMKQVIPRCPKCPADDPLAIMKPDIVFFGESLPTEFHRQMELDRDVCDLIIVMGSSLKVRPVALIPNSLPAKVPQILINREPLRHLNFDVELLGDCDVIVSELCHRLGKGWTSLCTTDVASRQITRDEMSTPPLSSRPSPMSVQPMSEDNSRMSFQQAADENSQMSMGGDERTETPPHNMLSAPGSSFTTKKAETAQTTLSALHGVGSTNNRLIPSDSSSSLCEMVGHMSTQQESDGSNSGPTSKADTEKLNTQTKVGREDDESLKVAADESDSMKTNLEVRDSLKTQTNDGLSPKVKTEDGDSSRGSLSELEELRACWEPRIVNLASRLKDGTFLFLPQSRYVFHGAEVYDDDDSDDDNNDATDDNDSSSSCSQLEEASPASPASPTPKAKDNDEVENLAQNGLTGNSQPDRTDTNGNNTDSQEQHPQTSSTS